MPIRNSRWLDEPFLQRQPGMRPGARIGPLSIYKQPQRPTAPAPAQDPTLDYSRLRVPGAPLMGSRIGPAEVGGELLTGSPSEPVASKPDFMQYANVFANVLGRAMQQQPQEYQPIGPMALAPGVSPEITQMAGERQARTAAVIEEQKRTQEEQKRTQLEQQRLEQAAAAEQRRLQMEEKRHALDIEKHEFTKDVTKQELGHAETRLGFDEKRLGHEETRLGFEERRVGVSEEGLKIEQQMADIARLKAETNQLSEINRASYQNSMISLTQQRLDQDIKDAGTRERINELAIVSAEVNMLKQIMSLTAPGAAPPSPELARAAALDDAAITAGFPEGARALAPVDEAYDPEKHDSHVIAQIADKAGQSVSTIQAQLELQQNAIIKAGKDPAQQQKVIGDFLKMASPEMRKRFQAANIYNLQLGTGSDITSEIAAAPPTIFIPEWAPNKDTFNYNGKQFHAYSSNFNLKTVAGKVNIVSEMSLGNPVFILSDSGEVIGRVKYKKDNNGKDQLFQSVGTSAARADATAVLNAQRQLQGAGTEAMMAAIDEAAKQEEEAKAQQHRSQEMVGTAPLSQRLGRAAAFTP